MGSSTRSTIHFISGSGILFLSDRNDFDILRGNPLQHASPSTYHLDDFLANVALDHDFVLVLYIFGDRGPGGEFGRELLGSFLEVNSCR